VPDIGGRTDIDDGGWLECSFEDAHFLIGEAEFEQSAHPGRVPTR
jgi:hypothetical protein